MGKRLAIKGHPTRSEEVIKLLEMMGGNDSNAFRCNNPNLIYYVLDYHTRWDYIGPEEIDEYNIFTLEDFLEKFPFKVGDFVRIPEYESEVRILKMKWCPLSEHIEYMVCPNDEEEWFTADELLEDNDNPNKTRDCKKCGLHFGSVRCFAIDCPHNTPKSYAVGLKDGKVIDCIANKETYMNEIKPLFKAGDVVKLKGDPDENLFWIVMDVVKDGYIFNGGEKCSFDDQHHYEKSNREVINIQPSKMKNVLAELLEYIKTTPKEELEREFEEIKEWSNVGPTIEEFMTFCECVNKKPVYPKNYEECCQHLGCDDKIKMELIGQFIRLINARNAYWKIAGEEMGLGKPWKPDWLSGRKEEKYCIGTQNNEIWHNFSEYGGNEILAFPTMEMRDVFYENFKDLIEQCKELL